MTDIAKIDKPIVWTLHDLWPLTGGCHIPHNCSRFKEGCGLCPLLASNSIDDLSEFTQQEFQIRTQDLFDQSLTLYNEMLTAGVAKECARDVLPLSTPTKLYMNGTLRSWLHYTDLRCANGTQLEHQLIATGVQELLKTHFPLVSEAMWPVKKMAEMSEQELTATFTQKNPHMGCCVPLF